MSAISTDKHLFVLKSINDVLKPGGLVLFRDYAIYDEAELRFNGNRRVTEHMFARQDGTLAFFFEKHGLIKCFQESGFEVVDCVYVKKEMSNVKKHLNAERLFLQGRFRKI